MNGTESGTTADASRDRLGDALVVGQVLALGALAWPGRARWSLAPAPWAAAAAATTLGVVVGVAAGRPHGRALTPRVAPPDGAVLLRTGPYAASRNPIYAALLLATAGTAVLRRRPEPLVAWAALLGVLNAKVRREEVHLARTFGPEYAAYRAATPRFLGPRSLTALRAARRDAGPAGPHQDPHRG